MKIKRFNSINENLTTDVKEFIEKFAGNTDSGILDWVHDVSSNTKLDEYKNFMSSNKKALNLANSKNFKKLEEYILIDSEIEKKRNELRSLDKKKEKLSLAAGDEVLYKFQEDLLINNDFNNFYEFFIKETIENSPTNNVEDILKYSEIHPKILKKYKNRIIISMESNKYNI